MDAAASPQPWQVSRPLGAGLTGYAGLNLVVTRFVERVTGTPIPTPWLTLAIIGEDDRTLAVVVHAVGHGVAELSIVNDGLRLRRCLLVALASELFDVRGLAAVVVRLPRQDLKARAAFARLGFLPLTGSPVASPDTVAMVACLASLPSVYQRARLRRLS